MFVKKNMAKIYTRTGDKGTTALVGGQRVPKHHIRLEAYGTIDELNSHIGLLLSQDIREDMHSFLSKVQYKLFDIGAYLATEVADLEKYKIVPCREVDVEEIEHYIDKLNETLPKLRHFIMPGGHQSIAICHIARTVCRRAERCITLLATETEVDYLVTKYVNRLSDCLFVICRSLAQDLSIDENKWNGF